ncbi:MAG: hypothetical protein V7603_5999, partial [Micromonosporaceae bacterium]
MSIKDFQQTASVAPQTTMVAAETSSAPPPAVPGRGPTGHLGPHRERGRA